MLHLTFHILFLWTLVMITFTSNKCFRLADLGLRGIVLYAESGEPHALSSPLPMGHFSVASVFVSCADKWNNSRAICLLLWSVSMFASNCLGYIIAYMKYSFHINAMNLFLWQLLALWIHCWWNYRCLHCVCHVRLQLHLGFSALNSC